MNTPFELFNKETPEGWDAVVDPLIEEASKRGITVLQVKEKFGGLRFYHNGHDNEEFDAKVAKAEELCYSMCSVCGQPGKVLYDGWVMPYCETHAKEAGREWK